MKTTNNFHVVITVQIRESVSRFVQMLIKSKSAAESHLPNREIQSFKIFLDSTRRYAFWNHNVISLRLESNQNLGRGFAILLRHLRQSWVFKQRWVLGFGPFVENSEC